MVFAASSRVSIFKVALCSGGKVCVCGGVGTGGGGAGGGAKSPGARGLIVQFVGGQSDRHMAAFVFLPLQAILVCWHTDVSAPSSMWASVFSFTDDACELSLTGVSLNCHPIPQLANIQLRC